MLNWYFWLENAIACENLSVLEEDMNDALDWRCDERRERKAGLIDLRRVRMKKTKYD